MSDLGTEHHRAMLAYRDRLHRAPSAWQRFTGWHGRHRRGLARIAACAVVFLAWWLATVTVITLARPCFSGPGSEYAVESNCTFSDGNHHITNIETGPVFVQITWPW